MGRIDYSADALKGVENNLKKHIKYIPLKN